MSYNKFAIARHLKKVKNKKSRQWINTVQLIRRALEYRYDNYIANPTCTTRNSFRSCYFNSNRFIKMAINLRPGIATSKVINDLREALNYQTTDYVIAKNHARA